MKLISNFIPNLRCPCVIILNWIDFFIIGIYFGKAFFESDLNLPLIILKLRPPFLEVLVILILRLDLFFCEWLRFWYFLNRRQISFATLFVNNSGSGWSRIFRKFMIFLRWLSANARWFAWSLIENYTLILMSFILNKFLVVLWCNKSILLIYLRSRISM